MIKLKSESEFAKMRRAGRILANFFEEIQKWVVPGKSTQQLDSFAENFIRTQGGMPAFKGYRGFPGTLCISVNEEVVHGIPGKRKLVEGDVVGVDVGAIVDGYYADAARTFAVGTVSQAVVELIAVTRDSLIEGQRKVVAGNRISDISHAVESHINRFGYGIVKNYVGHGIGSSLHEEPQIPNYGLPHRGPVIREGMALAIEPMVTMGAGETCVLEDGWTVVTKDKSIACHFENTLLVAANGVEVITE